jgi:uncharacterized protein
LNLTGNPELLDLCRRFHVRRLDVFGSAATERFDPARSDLDFLVEFAPDSPAGASDDYFGLREALIELFGRPVDLVMEPLRNPFFRQRVMAERKTVFQDS